MTVEMRNDINRFHALHAGIGVMAGRMGISRGKWLAIMTLWEGAERTILKGTTLATPPESLFDSIFDVIVGFAGREVGEFLSDGDNNNEEVEESDEEDFE